jgi:hypothetical protein
MLTSLYRFCLFLLLILGGNVSANAGQPPGYAEQLTLDSRRPSRVRVQGQAMTALGQHGDDLLLSLGLGAVFVHQNWQLAARLPIRLRLHNGDSGSNAAFVLEDWDELHDFARILPMVRYGHEGEPFFLSIGEINQLTLGHGTVLGFYTNNHLQSQFHGGIYVRGEVGVVTVEAILDDYLSPSVAALRFFVRPFKTKRVGTMVKELTFGLTLAADFSAPAHVRLAVAPNNTARLLELDSAVLPMLGTDIEMTLWRNPRWRVGLYADLNVMRFQGVGFHTGVHIEGQFTPLIRFNARAEYRYEGAGYRSAYFGPMYGIERYQMGEGTTKRTWLQQKNAGGHGFSGVAELDVNGVARVLLATAYHGDDGTADFLFRLSLPHLAGLRSSVYVARLGVSSQSDILDPQNTVVALTARYHLGKYFYLSGRVLNEWMLITDTARKNLLSTELNYDFGLGASVTF